MQHPFIRIHQSDTVLVALKELPQGMMITFEDSTFALKEPIPAAHKFACKSIAKGSAIIKYGNVIGKATKDIALGSHIHIHNVETNLQGIIPYTYQKQSSPILHTQTHHDTFMGYPRPNGTVGTRNEVWIIPTVSCVNHTVEKIAFAARKQYGHLCDSIVALPHNTGCSQIGDDEKMSQQILKGIAQHPNAGGVLFVSLGCENNNLSQFLPLLGELDPDRVKTMITQQIAGDEIETALALIESIIHTMQHDTRKETSVSQLVIGLKCGGSDAFSGITANPLTGLIADRIIEQGGSAILTEIPELFGAEQILMNRADSQLTFDAMVNLINSFKNYYLESNLPIYENPSPGNKTGGITTLEEKSLGNMQKSGSSNITAILTYGQRIQRPGINLLEGPGNDNVSITNLLASGAQILLFTTGRGTPLATMMPTIKIASNTKLAKNKPNWIDYDAGKILEGTSFTTACDELWKLICDIASGRIKTKSEIHSYRAISVFTKGPLL